jgi:RNA polymerase sigma factor (TIGR02999 family)
MISMPEASETASGGQHPTPVPAASEVTRILSNLEDDPSGSEDLLPLVYDELRRLAQYRLASEPAGQTLQATALVHEAYLRLVGSSEDPQDWESRRHFFGAAALAMRRILIDNARRKMTEKHGGKLQRVDIDVIDVAIGMKDEQVLRVDEAIEKLEAKDANAAELVRLRFFAGLSHADAANILNMSERTAKRTWAWARVWLYEEVSEDGN